MITLTKKNKKKFIIVSDTLLAILFLLMIVGFFLERSGLEHDFALKIIFGAVLVALVATPIRLVVISLLLFKEGQSRIAKMALSLIVILALGGFLKWYLL